MKYQTLADEACGGFKVYIAIKQKNQNLINVYLLASFVPFFTIRIVVHRHLLRLTFTFRSDALRGCGKFIYLANLYFFR